LALEKKLLTTDVEDMKKKLDNLERERLDLKQNMNEQLKAH
jgi:hypothetical protein